MNRAQGPAGEGGAGLRASLRARNLRLPLLCDNDETANRTYIKQFVLANDAALGKKHGLEWAEQFHYVGSEKPPVEEYVKQHVVPL